MTDITTIVRLLVILLLIALIVILVMRHLAVPYTLGLVIVGLLISIFTNALNVLPIFTWTRPLCCLSFCPPYSLKVPGR